MFAEHSAAFTHTPIFPLQSQYDAWQTGHVLKHGNDPAVVNLMGKNITERMFANIFTNHPDSGAFLDSCHHHCGALPPHATGAGAGAGGRGPRKLSRNKSRS